MVSRRLLLGATLGCLLIGLLGIAVYLQQRMARCDTVPLLAPELLPNAKLDAPAGGLPTGWIGATSGISVTDFTVLPGGHSLQLLGIANYVQTPEVTSVRPNSVYCFKGQAITDSPAGSTTRVRVTFQWLDDADALVGEDATPWQPVVLWQQDQPPAGWSIIDAAFRAPPTATRLRVRVSPASDDRVYLDQMHIRAGGCGMRDAGCGMNAASPNLNSQHPTPVVVLPWPDNRRAALSFSFDWETAMGGLVHSRSVGEPLGDDPDYVKRGLRMRQGITNTLEIFRPYRIRATYYATGYNFLLGNTERRTFMGNPTFAWAKIANRWRSDRWITTPWFADDPYGTVVSDPAWYFGDLVPLLQREGQDIQSHTFSHLYGGLASTAEWQADFAAWKEVAAERSVPPARSLAFPWSGSDGMSDANWNLLEEQGIRSVTRLSDYAQYRIMRDNDPHCGPVPGHERILACPDFYLTPATAQQARELVDHTLAVSGTIDLWSHTEEVTSDEQIAAWRATVAYAAAKPDLWIAPLDEIASWQQALAELKIDNVTMQQTTSAAQETAPLSFKLTNMSQRDMAGLCLQLPWKPGKTTLDGQVARAQSSNVLTLDIKAGQSMEVRVWPAS